MKILLKNTIQFYLSARTLRDVKDDFVRDFMLSIMDTSKIYGAYVGIEEQREAYLRSTEYIEFVDFGTGSKNGKRSIQKIARKALSRKRQCRMLFQLINTYACQNIIELGTSLGISTMYLAAANTKAKVTTLEGNPATVDLVRQVFNRKGFSNIEVVQGDFSKTLPVVLENTAPVDFVFFDGNHAYEPTIAYFNQVLPYCHSETILVFDDIYWSKDMHSAWCDIKSHPSVTIALDLHFMGVIFFKEDLDVKIDKKLIDQSLKPF